MSRLNETLVDFVVRGKETDEWRMVLVEEGPWLGHVDDELRRIQDRLYGCLDAILDGHLAAKFPETLGKHVVVQLDCYELPRQEVEAFFKSFASGVLRLDDYRHAVEGREYVQEITFGIDFPELPPRADDK